MTDIRKAAQAVLDEVDTPIGPIHPAIISGRAIEALRQALAEPVEPVAYMIYKHGELYTTKCANSYRPKGGVYTEIPLYTAPPSVDALIAEIDAIDCEYLDDYEVKVKAILDKYKGQK